jgi:hypothetical protein
VRDIDRKSRGVRAGAGLLCNGNAAASVGDSGLLFRETRRNSQLSAMVFKFENAVGIALHSVDGLP